jgi:micrococcal nuclease
LIAVRGFRLAARRFTAFGLAAAALLCGATGCAGDPASSDAPAESGAAAETSARRGPRRSARTGEPQRRPVEKSRLRFDDGDTVDILWDGGEKETVRLLGIDTPEIAHPEHKLPVAQPYGERAAGFLEGCLARSEKLELLDRGQKDPYGRTLGYLFLDGRNYSVLVLEAGLATESVSQFGDNGFPVEAAACLEAARKPGPLPFEPPHEWRKRFRVFVDHRRAGSAGAVR